MSIDRCAYLDERGSNIERYLMGKMIDDRRLSWLFSAIVFLLFITNCSAVINNYIEVSQEKVTLLCKGILLLLLMYRGKTLLRSFRLRAFYFVLIISIIFLVNMLFFGINTSFQNTLISFYTMVLPMVLICIGITDYEVLFIHLRKTAYLIVGIMLIVIVLQSLKPSQDAYWMGLGYSMLLPAIILMRYFLKFQLKRDLVSFAIAVIEISIYGSRGPLLCILCYCMMASICYILQRRKINRKDMFFIVFTTIGLALLEKFILLLIRLLDFFGISSRTFKLFTNDIVLQDSGRHQIQSIVLNVFQSAPMKIRGINADFEILQTYSHNIFIELLYCFGILIATMAIIFIISLIVKTIKDGTKESISEMQLIFCCLSIPALMVSGTFWQESYFWIWILLCLKNQQHLRIKYRRACG